MVIISKDYDITAVVDCNPATDCAIVNDSGAVVR
jgi:hypothetical protein